MSIKLPTLTSLGQPTQQNSIYTYQECFMLTDNVNKIPKANIIKTQNAKYAIKQINAKSSYKCQL